jgi:hypothetical protein
MEEENYFKIGTVFSFKISIALRILIFRAFLFLGLWKNIENI